MSCSLSLREQLVPPAGVLVNNPHGMQKCLYTWLPVFPLSNVGVCSYIEVCRGWTGATWLLGDSFCQPTFKKKREWSNWPACTEPIRCERAAVRYDPTLPRYKSTPPLSHFLPSGCSRIINFDRIRAVKRLTAFKQFSHWGRQPLNTAASSLTCTYLYRGRDEAES